MPDMWSLLLLLRWVAAIHHGNGRSSGQDSVCVRRTGSGRHALWRCKVLSPLGRRRRQHFVPCLRRTTRCLQSMRAGRLRVPNSTRGLGAQRVETDRV